MCWAAPIINERPSQTTEMLRDRYYVYIIVEAFFQYNDRDTFSRTSRIMYLCVHT